MTTPDTTSPEVIVIGGGPGGYVCAIRLAQRGKRVLLVEREALGGVCLNWGCIPSKALIYAARLYEKIQHASGMGIEVSGVSVNFPQLIAWKDGIVSKLTGGIRVLMGKHKIEIVAGTARFTSPTDITVVDADGQETVYTAPYYVIATGSRILELPNLPYDHRVVIDSTDALSLPELPKRMAVVGGGIIGLELGLMYAKLGVEITVIELGSQLLPGIDAEIAQTMHRVMKKEKIAAHLDTQVTQLTVSNNSATLTLSGPKGETILEVDRVLVCVGRRPNADNLGLDKAGVALTEKGFIHVNDQLRTSQPHIFAIGDVTATPYLAHKASKEGLVVADAMLGRPTKMNVLAMPSAVFTTPEIATVGLTEAQARERVPDIRVGKFPFAASGRAMSMGETDGFVKVIADAKTDQILGVHMIGPDVSELIAEAALAIELRAKASDLALTVHAHPTLPETLMEAAESVHKLAIHIYEA